MSKELDNLAQQIEALTAQMASFAKAEKPEAPQSTEQKVETKASDGLEQSRAYLDEMMKKREAEIMATVNPILVEKRIDQLIQKTAEEKKWPSQWLNMYRKHLVNRAAATV